MIHQIIGKLSLPVGLMFFFKKMGKIILEGNSNSEVEVVGKLPP